MPPVKSTFNQVSKAAPILSSVDPPIVLAPPPLPPPSDVLPVQLKMRRQLRWALILIGLLPVGTLSLALAWVDSPAWFRAAACLVIAVTLLAAFLVTRHLSALLEGSTREMRDLATTINHSASSIITELSVLRRRIEELAANETDPPNHWN